MDYRQQSKLGTRPAEMTCPVCKQTQKTIVEWDRTSRLSMMIRKYLRPKRSKSPTLDHFCSKCYVKLGRWSPYMLMFCQSPYLTVKAEELFNRSVRSWAHRPGPLPIQRSPFGAFPQPTESSPHIELVVPLHEFVLCVEEQKDTIVIAPRASNKGQSAGPVYSLHGSIKSLISATKEDQHRLQLRRTDELKRSQYAGSINSGHFDWILKVRPSTNDIYSPWDITLSMDSIATEQGWLDWDDKNLVDVYGRTAASYEHTWNTDNKIYIKYAPMLELTPKVLDHVLLIVLARAIIDIRDPETDREIRREYSEPRSYYSNAEVLGAERVAALEREKSTVFESKKAAFIEQQRVEMAEQEAKDAIAKANRPDPSRPSPLYDGQPRTFFKKQDPRRYSSGGGGGDIGSDPGWDQGLGWTYDSGGVSSWDIGGSSGGGDSGGGGGGGDSGGGGGGVGETSK